MQKIDSYKGIAPGKIIQYKLKEMNMTQKELANNISCHPQTINAIIKSTREIPRELSFKLDNQLGFETGFFLLAQTYYRIKQYTDASVLKEKPIPKIRKVIFWDIDINTLDWQKNKDFIIKRVQKRGNNDEIKSILNYYGAQ